MKQIQIDYLITLHVYDFTCKKLYIPVPEISQAFTEHIKPIKLFF